jgi:hypothetical protein
MNESEDMNYEYEVKDNTESTEQKNDPNDIDVLYFEKDIVSTAAKMESIMDVQTDSMNLDDPNEHVDTQDAVDDRMDEVKEALEPEDYVEDMEFDDGNNYAKKHLVGTAAEMVPDVDMLDIVDVRKNEVEEVLELNEAKERRSKIWRYWGLEFDPLSKGSKFNPNFKKKIKKEAGTSSGKVKKQKHSKNPNPNKNSAKKPKFQLNLEYFESLADTSDRKNKTAEKLTFLGVAQPHTLKKKPKLLFFANK